MNARLKKLRVIQKPTDQAAEAFVEAAANLGDDTTMLLGSVSVAATAAKRLGLSKLDLQELMVIMRDNRDKRGWIE